MRISFDRVAEIFDRTRGPPKQVMEQLVKTLVNELRDYGTILDAGVGTGRFAKPLQDNGFEVFGIDRAKKMMSKAVEKGVDNLLQADACLIPFRNESFDATVA
jgi:ubiquinone/menaquinone biosynthesis C-methylase UbiE